MRDYVLIYNLPRILINVAQKYECLQLYNFCEGEIFRLIATWIKCGS
jgi:hypothetical protein